MNKIGCFDSQVVRILSRQFINVLRRRRIVVVDVFFLLAEPERFELQALF